MSDEDNNAPGWFGGGTETNDASGCTCHPDDNPPTPCPRKYALSECRLSAAFARIEALQAERDAAVLAEREAIADWCYHHTMDTVTDARKAEYAGSYVAGEYSPESGARHHGMGYAAAIRARSNKEPEQ